LLRALVGDALTDAGRRRVAVVIRDGTIVDVIPDPLSGDLPDDQQTVSGLICPGFIDLQINGGFRADVGPDSVSLEALARRLPETGVTAFLPTAISWPVERYRAFCEVLEGLPSSDTSGARILGAHIEGPFLAPARKGAHDPANLRPVDLGLLREILSSRQVSLMTLAPELPGALDAIGALSEEGAVASAGHTDATYEEIRRALDAGLKMGTHLYNAMSPLQHRAPGAVGALLTDDRARVGIIADGVHVHEGALRVAYRAKGTRGLALVTDAMEAAGMPPGEYELSGRLVRLQDGAVRLPDGTLAGSALTMDQAVRNAADFLSVSLEEAVRMATQTPADILGFAEKGRISAGADADLTLLGTDGAVQETIVAGETVYQRQEVGS
jgi:N-acetylglucosamine-6-phosphate deacetylase